MLGDNILLKLRTINNLRAVPRAVIHVNDSYHTAPGFRQSQIARIGRDQQIEFRPEISEDFNGRLELYILRFQQCCSAHGERMMREGVIEKSTD